MEISDKHYYESPSTEVVEVETEGIIATSTVKTSGTPTLNSFNDEEDW